MEKKIIPGAIIFAAALVAVLMNVNTPKETGAQSVAMNQSVEMRSANN